MHPLPTYMDTWPMPSKNSRSPGCISDAGMCGRALAVHTPARQWLLSLRAENPASGLAFDARTPAFIPAALRHPATVLARTRRRTGS